MPSPRRTCARGADPGATQARHRFARRTNSARRWVDDRLDVLRQRRRQVRRMKNAPSETTTSGGRDHQQGCCDFRLQDTMRVCLARALVLLVPSRAPAPTRCPDHRGRHHESCVLIVGVPVHATPLANYQRLQPLPGTTMASRAARRDGLVVTRLTAGTGLTGRGLELDNDHETPAEIIGSHATLMSATTIPGYPGRAPSGTIQRDLTDQVVICASLSAGAEMRGRCSCFCARLRNVDEQVELVALGGRRRPGRPTLTLIGPGPSASGSGLVRFRRARVHLVSPGSGTVRARRLGMQIREPRDGRTNVTCREPDTLPVATPPEHARTPDRCWSAGVGRALEWWK